MLAPAVREARLQVRHVVLAERIPDDPHGAAVLLKHPVIARHYVGLLGGQTDVCHVTGGRAAGLDGVAVRRARRHVQCLKNAVQPDERADGVPVGVRFVVQQPVCVLPRLAAQHVIPPDHRHCRVALQIGRQQVGAVFLVHNGVAVRHVLAVDAVLAGRQIQHQRAAVFGQLITQDLQARAGLGQCVGAVVQLGQPLIVCHRLRGVGAVLVEQPAVLAGQHLVALARAEQRVVQPGVHQHKLIAERRVIDQKVVEIARQLPQRALQHLRQTGHQAVFVTVHRQLFGKNVEHRERQPDDGAEHADKANFDRFTHGSAPPLKLKINKRAVGACRDAHKSQKQQHEQPRHPGRGRCLFRVQSRLQLGAQRLHGAAQQEGRR